MKARWEIDLSPGGRKRPLSAGPRRERKGEACAGCEEELDTAEPGWLEVAPLAGAERPYHRDRAHVDALGITLTRGMGPE